MALENHIPTDQQVNSWMKSFHQNAFLVLDDVLSAGTCEILKQDYFAAKEVKGAFVERIFEESEANLNLFWLEPIVTFAERLIADNHCGHSVCNEVHVIHNNSFRIKAG